VWGPDGKLYVASLDGRITALEFDEDYQLSSRVTYPGVSGLPSHDTLSLAIDPYDPPSPLRLYVGHGHHFVNDGGTPNGPSPYTGQISVLSGPDFAAPIPLITGLPVSNHDHAINGIAFDDDGDLFISVGSMTNAGVLDSHMGGLPESPLSAAVLKARLSKPGFSGAITYTETATGLPNADQRSGELVDVAPGANVALHASGLRNAYGLVYTTRGQLYATDNGPNAGFGAASTGMTTASADPQEDDELDLIEWGNYYGSPNRSRGRTDPRQCVYYAGYHGPPSIPDTLFQLIAWLPSSSDGVDEYRANTFRVRCAATSSCSATRTDCGACACGATVAESCRRACSTRTRRDSAASRVRAARSCRSTSRTRRWRSSSPTTSRPSSWSSTTSSRGGLRPAEARPSSSRDAAGRSRPASRSAAIPPS
jgi:hypothetical protein